jgi:hypothetical protein
VADALDECNNKESITDFIQVLTHSSEGVRIPFQFLLTSRVEEHTRSELEASVGQAHPMTYSLALQNFPAGADIRTFFLVSFFDHLSPERPSNARRIQSVCPTTFTQAAVVALVSHSIRTSLSIMVGVGRTSTYKHD